jgi:intergrase/recombinase
MKYFLPLFLILGSYSIMQGQGCLNLDKYHEKMEAADSCIAIGNYSLAQDNYNAAIVYCEERSGEVEKAKDELFNEINKLREEAILNKTLAEKETERALVAEREAKEKEEELQRALDAAKESLRNALGTNWLTFLYEELEDGNIGRQHILNKILTTIEKDSTETLIKVNSIFST